METDKTTEKFARLQELIKGYGSVLIAFSGGSDSSLVVAAAQTVLSPENVLAVTLQAIVHPADEVEQAKALTTRLGVRHEIVRVKELPPAMLNNPPDRCYICKKYLFSKLQAMATARELAVVVDGSNIDDLSDFRPGHKALAELEVCSPLREAGLHKTEINELLVSLELSDWVRLPNPCLATRFPHGVLLSDAGLRRVEKAERAVRALGYQQVRVRDHYPVGRIELERSQLEKGKREIASLTDALRAAGYKKIELELDGYKMGRFNVETGNRM